MIALKTRALLAFYVRVKHQGRMREDVTHAVHAVYVAIIFKAISVKANSRMVQTEAMI